MAKKSKQPPYGVWRNPTKEELEAMKKDNQEASKITFEQTIKAMSKTPPISNKEIIEHSKKHK